MRHSAEHWLEALRGLDLDQPVRIMNVCGGHERSISVAGLRTAIPEAIELVPGPGCPVCICPEEDIYDAIQLALTRDVTVVAFGDMLRVPVNVPRREVRSLEQARAAGADVRPIATPQEAAAIARENDAREVVFFAAGFETTTAPVAALLAQGVPDNLSILLSGRRTWPAVELLLQSGDPGFDALVAPGHVSAVVGAEEWEGVAKHYGIRTQRYKLIRFYEFDEWEFYDLLEDPDELTNRYEDRRYAQVINNLKNDRETLRRRYRDDTDVSVKPPQWQKKFRPESSR